MLQQFTGKGESPPGQARRGAGADTVQQARAVAGIVGGIHAKGAGTALRARRRSRAWSAGWWWNSWYRPAAQGAEAGLYSQFQDR